MYERVYLEVLGLCWWAVPLGLCLHRLEVRFVCLCDGWSPLVSICRVCAFVCVFEEVLAVLCNGENRKLGKSLTLDL